MATANGAWVFRAARGIVLNPGTEPTVPPIDGLTGTPYWTNREAVAAEQVLESVIVLGGGPVGCEFAQVFARFGAGVTMVETHSRLLAGDEPEASDLLAEVFAGEHIDVRTGVSAAQVSHSGEEFAVRLDGGEVMRAQRLLVATGRHTDLAALGVGARSVSTIRHARSRSTAGCAPPTACGRSGTSPAGAPSPTCRCIRRGSPRPTSSDRTARPPTTGRSRG
ncbi:MAG: FAD-dependent oxidoreductase [Pseudonocardiaceae bacterium]